MVLAALGTRLALKLTKGQFISAAFPMSTGAVSIYHTPKYDRDNLNGPLNKPGYCRWAFTILAFTNKRFQIVRVDGRHVPEGTLLQEQEAAEFGDEQWGLDERFNILPR